MSSTWMSVAPTPRAGVAASAAANAASWEREMMLLDDPYNIATAASAESLEDDDIIPLTNHNDQWSLDKEERDRLRGQVAFKSACRLVQDILDQITLNDSPPMNEDVVNNISTPTSNSAAANMATAGSTSTSVTSAAAAAIAATPSPANKYSRQQHVFLSGGANTPSATTPSVNGSTNHAMSPALSPASTDPLLADPGLTDHSSSNHSFTAINTLGFNNNNDQLTLWMKRYQMSETRAESKMGHVALATLCSRTLESFRSHLQEGPAAFIETTITTTPAPSTDRLAMTDDSTNAKQLRRASESAAMRPTTAVLQIDTRPTATAAATITKTAIPSAATATTTTTTTSPDGPSSKHKNRRDMIKPQRWLSWRNHNKSPSAQQQQQHRLEQHQDFLLNRAKKAAATNPTNVVEPTPASSTCETTTTNATPSLNTESASHDEDGDIEASGGGGGANNNHALKPPPMGMSPTESPASVTKRDPQLSVIVNTNRDDFVAQSSPRLKMFGSEYARFLSSTALAPSTPNNSHATAKNNSSTLLPRRASVAGGGVARAALDQLNAAHKLEDANNSILTGTITDILITYGEEMPPKGYFRISQTGQGDEFKGMLRRTSASNKPETARWTLKQQQQVYINVKKEPNWDRAAQRPCVTALAVIFPDRKEFVPPGFCVVHRHINTNSNSVGHGLKNRLGNRSRSSRNVSNTLASSLQDSSSSTAKNVPANLNYGSPSGERVYLCFRRSREGNPITGIIPLQPSNHEPIPEGYTVLERTPRNYVADINAKSGSPVFLAFRQRLANLEPLRPLPLVLSVHSADPFGAAAAAAELKSRKHGSAALHHKRLHAYYCTGGTVVVSDVGRFHIMDRTTHSLLSPSSISNRMSLIELSRRRAATNLADAKQVRPLATYASSSGTRAPLRTNDLLSSTFRAAHGLPVGVSSDDTCQISVTSGTSFMNSSFVSDMGMTGDASSVTDSMTSSMASSSMTSSSEMYFNNRERLLRDNMMNDSIAEHAVPPYDGGGGSDTPISPGGGGSDGHMFIIPPAGEQQSRKNSTGSLPTDDDELQQCLEALNFIPTIEAAEQGHDPAETMLVLQQRAALLTPILTACYSRHGGSALIAVDGLTKLLKDVDFFRMDVAENGAASSSRLTLLDITVQAVCDVATTGAQETSFSTCVEFVEAAIRYSRGQLNTRTMGYVLRFYLFVFYFGATIPTTANWPNPIWGQSSGDMAMKEGKMDDDIPMLWDPRGGSAKYLPGGAPQAAALALKELITWIVKQLRRTISTAEAATTKSQSKQSLKSFVEGMLSSLVDKAVHQVDIANYTQLAMHQVHRSGGSELFWHDMMNACGAGLFNDDESLDQAGRDIFIVSFALLANLVKVCSGKMRRVSQTSQLVPRDVASKILSLELLLHFLEQWGDEQVVTEPTLQSVETLLFCVRRLVVPCLLSNTKAGLEDPRVFRRLIRIVSALLCSPVYRKHMKAEIGVLMEHFALRMLQLGPQLLPLSRLHARESNSKGGSGALADELSPSLLPQQVELVIAIKRWFSGPPIDIVELYLNFDTNIEGQINGPIQIMPGTQWKVCQQLCALLSSIAEQCGEILGEQVRFSHLPGGLPSPRPVASFSELQDQAGATGSGLAEMSSLRENARLLRQVTLEAIAQITKSLAQSAAKACGKRFHRLLSVWPSFNPPDIEDLSSLPSFALDERSTSTVSSIDSGSNSRSPRGTGTIVDNLGLTASGSSERAGIIDYWQTAILSERRKAGGAPSVQTQHGASAATSIVKNTTKWQSTRTLQSVHGIAHGNDVTTSAIEPLEVAFQIAHEKSLKRAVDYLVACNMLSPAPRDVASFLRIHKARLNPSILGDYLGEGGNDGAEAEYWNLIRFSYVRAISFAGMTVEQGLRNFLTNGGFRLPGEAQNIDRILATFAQCYWEDNAGDIPRCPFHDQDTVFLISFAIIMLNTDLHKTGKSGSRKRKKMTKTEFLNNLRGVENMEELTREYLSTIFDSVEANPIVLVDEVEPCGNFRLSAIRGVQHYDVITLLTSMLNSVKTSDALLRGLSVHEHAFFQVKDFSNSFEYGENDALADLTRCFVATTWHHFHGVINAALETAHLDPEGMESCIEVLGYALCVTISLDMHMERVAFLNQLERFKLFKDRRQGHWLPALAQEEYENEALYTRIEKICAEESPDSEKRRLNALLYLNRAIHDLHSSFAVDAHVKKDMKRIVSRIRDGEFLLNDPSRRFLREGDLLKKSNRSGRFVEYRFFLFSDMLVYSKFSTVSNDYKIHEELPLHLMKIVDWFPPDANKKSAQQSKRCFQIHHPNKTFLVAAGSSDERKSWVSDIRLAIDEEVRRKAHLEAARVAASSTTVGH